MLKRLARASAVIASTVGIVLASLCYSDQPVEACAVIDTPHISTIKIVDTLDVAEITEQNEANEARMEYKRDQANRMKDADDELDELHVDVPEDIVNICEEAGDKYDISPELLESIAWRESRFDPKATNGDCVGLCQVNYKFHSKRIGGDLYDKTVNIYTAADYLSELFSSYEDVSKVLNIYGGYKGNSPSPYTNKILYVAECLEVAHGK